MGKLALRHFLSASSIALGVMLATPELLAEATQEQRDSANALMDRGDALIERGSPADALELYQQAHALMGVPTTGIEVAKTLVKLGRLVEAKKLADEVAAMPVLPDEREPFAAARIAARALAAELSVRIPKLVVRAPRGSEVRLDGAVLPGFSLERELELDPGEHVVVAKRGTASRTQRVKLTERAHETLVIELGEPPLAKIGPAPSPRPPPRASSRSSTLRTVGWIGIGVGAAGMAFGATTGVLALGARSKLDDGGCSDGRCAPSQADDVDRYNDLRMLSGAGLIGGAVLAAAGTALVILSEPHATREKARARWSPRVSRHAAFSF